MFYTKAVANKKLQKQKIIKRKERENLFVEFFPAGKEIENFVSAVVL
jgi:hypothetical protein